MEASLFLAQKPLAKFRQPAIGGLESGWFGLTPSTFGTNMGTLEHPKRQTKPLFTRKPNQTKPNQSLRRVTGLRLGFLDYFWDSWVLGFIRGFLGFYLKGPRPREFSERADLFVSPRASAMNMFEALKEMVPVYNVRPGGTGSGTRSTKGL